MGNARGPYRKIDWRIRYWARVDKRGPDECWPWTGYIDKSTGYGKFSRDRTSFWAHRVGYEVQIGPIEDGLLVCHTCDNRPCQNGAHFFPGTHGDNNRDGFAKGRMHVPIDYSLRTHCPQGHPLDGRNKNQRYCKTCHRARQSRLREQKRTVSH